MREYGPGRPLVFNHIPKCAGTSLRTALEAALHPSVIVRGLDLALASGYVDLAALPPAARAEFHERPEDLRADADLVAGHVSPGTTSARFPDADHLTVLRNPRLRTMSQWLHSRSLSDFDLRHWGSGTEAFTVARRPLAEYLEHERLAPNVDNTITRFLTWPHPALAPDRFIDEADDADLLTAAHARLDAMGHVGLVEDRDHVRAIGEWLGRGLPDVRLNERQSVPRRQRPDLAAELTEATVELLDHRTRLDRELWSRVVAERLPGTDPVDLLETSWRRTVDRYAAALAERGAFRPVRRTAEVAYGVGTRLRRSVRGASG